MADEPDRRKLRLEFGESRPLMWWTLHKRWWKPHWTEDEIPAEWRDAHEKNKAKRGWK